ncbi:MAG: sigma-70 family RNA polymerase sigma factor [Muribaculaceae bacterium]|nr:sigma-70 family RNA polymerase sigma factor [Muribaculaceae bacterium]
MDSRLFKEKVIPLHSQMYRIAYCIVANQPDAEDIVQDCILKLWDRRHQLSSIDDLNRYCCTMVRNHAIDHLRRHNGSDFQDEHTLSNMADSTSSDSYMLHAETSQQVKEMIRTLPNESRKVLCLRVFSECSIDDIEQATGLSSSNIRTMLCRARKKLRSIYEKM